MYVYPYVFSPPLVWRDCTNWIVIVKVIHVALFLLVFVCMCLCVCVCVVKLFARAYFTTDLRAVKQARKHP
jgi:hypothetical protein